MSRLPVNTLLVDLAQDGVQLSVRGDRLRVTAPHGILTPERREALQRERPALVTLMADAECLLDAPLEVFKQASVMVEVVVPRICETLWFVSGERQVEVLVGEGVRRGRIWTAAELRDLWQDQGLTHEDVVRLARAKLAFNATVVDVRPDSPPTTPAAQTIRPSKPEPVQPSLDLDATPQPGHNR